MISKDDLRREVNQQKKVIKYYQLLVIGLLGSDGAIVSQNGEVKIVTSSKKSVKAIVDMLDACGFGEDVKINEHDDGLSEYSVVFRIISPYV